MARNKNLMGGVTRSAWESLIRGHQPRALRILRERALIQRVYVQDKSTLNVCDIFYPNALPLSFE